VKYNLTGKIQQMEAAWGNRRASEINVIKVRGNLELLTAEQLDEVIESVVRSEACNIIVDLQDVVYISSKGWGVFLSKIKEIRETGGDLVLTAMRPEVHEVFRLLEFDMFLKSYPTIFDAANNFDVAESSKERLES